MKQQMSDLHGGLVNNRSREDVLLHESSTINDDEKARSVTTPTALRKVESTTTSVTGGESYTSEEDTNGSGGGGGWFLGGIGADFRTLALTLRDTAGGVVNFVHRSAINVANEIALLEDNDDDMMMHGPLDHNGGSSRTVVEPLHLPWEIRNENGEYTPDEDLMTQILQVSQKESSFMGPYSSVPSRLLSASTAGQNEDDDDGDESFVLDHARVQLIRRLLKLDPHLSSMHARLSGRSDVRETNFWRNYFYACSETRTSHVEAVKGSCGGVDHHKQQSLVRQYDDRHAAADAVDDVAHCDTNLSQCSPNSLVLDDEHDLDGTTGQTDDDSFVFLASGGSIPSGPNSVKSTGMRSIDSLVVVSNNALNEMVGDSPTTATP